MALRTSDVRIEERLRIKIGEAKNLPARSHGSSGLRDCYCVISLDQEDIFRTGIVEKALSPLFCEEFQFEVPRKFRFLSIYLYDREKVANKDKVLGKVAIKREDLHKYNGKDHWFPMLPADCEVQGKVHVEVKLDQYIKASNSGSFSHRLLIRVIECNDLTIINGACDPYAVASVWHAGKMDTKRTKARKKTICPQFDETFWFELPMRYDNPDKSFAKLIEDGLSSTELRISMMHDSSGVFGSVFLGEVKIPLHGIDLNKGHNAWYFLQPKDKCKVQKTDLGSLRLKIFYTSDHVFSSQFYEPLKELLLRSPDISPITSSAAYILGQIVSNKLEAAQPLIKVFLHHGKVVPFIKALAEWEISKVTDPNTIFRGNTLVSKCMDEFMKLTGMHYLHETLRSTIELILSEHKPCEIDNARLKEGESLETNMANLTEYTERMFRAITNSALTCPDIMCEVFSTLKELACRYFPNNTEVRYSVISGFVFLRFFAPAILGPKLFELSTETVDCQSNRTLTLISKTIQSLGNLVSSKSPKEEYMVLLYKDFVTEKRMNSVRVFLELISSSTGMPIQLQPRRQGTPIILKEGVMIKRAQGRKKFGMKNFKKRYFCLTTQELFYSKVKGGTPLCKIPIDEMLAVEKLQEETFKMKNMFQVIQPQRVLYIQANNCVEEMDWLDILSKVCQSNRNRLKEYHPAAFINGHWLCCKANNENTSGCCPVIASVPPDIRVHIDSDREIERIHTIFLSNMEILERLREACENQAVYTGDGSAVSTTDFIIEDTQSMWETLTSVRACVIQLEQDHKQYLRAVCRQTRYGSEQAPIGDDNYLLMMAQHSK